MKEPVDSDFSLHSDNMANFRLEISVKNSAEGAAIRDQIIKNQESVKQIKEKIEWCDKHRDNGALTMYVDLLKITLQNILEGKK